MRINKCFYCMEDMQPGQCKCPHCGKAVGEDSQPEYALPCGSILHGKYLIGAVLGQGGFGITYIGYDLTLNLKVAIKEYFPTAMAIRSTTGAVLWSKSGIPKEQGCANFLKEARKMAKLQSIPEIVSVTEILMENDTAYIVMEFIEGTTLKTKLRRDGVMPVGEATELLCPVIRALGEAHQHGIIHRDISPDNIMINTSGRALLLDLGAAKEVDMRSESDKQSSQLIHKDGFSPPEQYAQGGDIGPWTDVYAMCATLYYAVTGRLVPASIDRMIYHTPIEFTDNVPKKMRQVLLKGLSTDAKQRYQSMDELLNALPVTTDPHTVQYQSAVASLQAARSATDYKKLEKAFKSLNGYKDSEARAAECRQKITKLEKPKSPKQPKASKVPRMSDAPRVKFEGPAPQSKPDSGAKVRSAMIGIIGAVVVLAGAVLFFSRSTSVKVSVKTSPEITAATEYVDEAGYAETELAEVTPKLTATPSPSPSPSPTPSPSPSPAPEPTPTPTPNKFALANVGDYVTFGTYEQDKDSTNGAEDVEWLVLDKNEDSVLLISRYVLDSKRYNAVKSNVTWETCSLRAWLNEDFYNTAFNAEEQAMIAITDVVTDDYYDIDGGNDTQDKIFLLSTEEAETYFTSQGTRACKKLETLIYNLSDNSRWWLRSPGNSGKLVAVVSVDGSISTGGRDVDYTEGVRPAMWVNIASSAQTTTTSYETLETSDVDTSTTEANASPNPALILSPDTSDFTSVNVGDYVIFGTYEQDNDLTNGTEDIEWLVLDKTEDGLLLISRYVLDCQPYNTISTDVTWETCSLRSWLNEDFYNAAFDVKEQAMIATATVTAEEISGSWVNPGNDTQDKVFLLSVNESKTYFADNEARQCKPTAYAVANGVYEDTYSNCSRWWLRTPGRDVSGFAATVNQDGSVSSLGDHVGFNYLADRPALWISLIA